MGVRDDAARQVKKILCRSVAQAEDKKYGLMLLPHSVLTFVPRRTPEAALSHSSHSSSSLLSLLTCAMAPSCVWHSWIGIGLITPTRHEVPGEKVDLRADMGASRRNHDD